jgi:hypothetical protein
VSQCEFGINVFFDGLFMSVGAGEIGRCIGGMNGVERTEREAVLDFEHEFWVIIKKISIAQKVSRSSAE